MSKIDELKNYLKANDVVANKDDIEIRKSVFEKLQILLGEWLKEYFTAQGTPLTRAPSCYGKLFKSGSFALGCITKNSDLDLICILSNSKNLTRECFFSNFKKFVESQPEVKYIYTIENSTCPLMKMNFQDIDVDISVTMLQCETIPEDYLSDDLLEGMDEISVKSYMGLKSVDTYLKLIPNKELFDILICSIKLWAKRKGLYSNPIGYLSGASCTVLCIYICSIYKDLNVYESIRMFFKVFSEWKWPDPVTLTNLHNGSTDLKSWNQFVDSDQVMPILTPDYPHKNCAFNVTLANRKIIVIQFKKALEIVNKIKINEASWENLFETSTFFDDYNFYLAVIVTSENHEDHILWQGLVESKLRFLVIDLDKLPTINVLQVYPLPFMYKNKFDEYLTKWMIGFQINNIGNSVLNIQPEIKRFRHFVINRVKQNGWFKENMMIYVDGLTRKDANPKDYLPSKLTNFFPL